MLTNVNPLVIWIVIAIVSAIVEALTVSIVSCWFTIGSLSAMLAYFIGANPTTQFFVFIISTALSLLIARPLIKKHNKVAIQPTNADMLINQYAIVTEEINNLLSTGTVKIKGLEWTARSDNDEIIPVSAKVKIIRIEGVKLIVSAYDK